MPFSRILLPLALAWALSAQQTPDLRAAEERAQAEFSRRDYGKAAEAFRESIAAAISTGDTARVGLYYSRLATSLQSTGDLEGSLDAATRGVRAGEVAGDRELIADNLQAAGVALLFLGRSEDALPLAEREYALARECGHPGHLIRAMRLVGILDRRIGRARDGMRILEAAVGIARANADEEATRQLLSSLAVAYAEIGDPDTGIPMLREVLGLTDPGDSASLAMNWSNLGEMQLDAGKPAEAVKTLSTALSFATTPRSRSVRVSVLTSLARIHLNAGDFGAARTESTQALDLAREGKLADFESAVQNFRAGMFLQLHDVKGAGEAAEEALRLGREGGSGARIYRALFVRGEVRDARGEHVAARADFDEALRVTDIVRAASSGNASDLRSQFESLVPLYRAAVRNLLDQQLAADALRRTEEAKARVLMDILLRGGVDGRKVLTSDETAERTRLRQILARANRSPGRATESAAADLRRFERAVYAAHPELALQSANFEAAGPQQLAALLPDSHTALFDYFFIPSGVALFVVRGSHVTAHVLPDPDNSLVGQIRHFRRQMASRDLDYKPEARRLFTRLIAPALPALGDTTDWIVSPDGALWEMPFAALIDSAGRHVLETRSLTIVPSLTAALKLRQRTLAPAGTGIPLLAVGNPLPSAASLPDAAEEARRIGTITGRGAIVLTGTGATRQAFLAQAQDARMIHLAAHASLNDRDPLSSFVTFASASGDGSLTARDILDLRLRADLVVLSGCDTALGDTRPGEGMIGMGWALLAAGASSSVLSYWKVDSPASRDFMIALYRRLPGAPKAAALRQTAIEIMRSPGHRHPFYWAPFTLWGS